MPPVLVGIGWAAEGNLAKAINRQKTPVISIVGNSGAGKTTFLEKLVPALRARGYRVACIKHDVHNFDIDHPGKDTWRLARAGSDVVMIASPKKMALIANVNEEPTLPELVAMLAQRADIVLTEGYRSAATLKIEVSRRAAGSQLVAAPEQLLALVTDQAFALAVPQFGLDDAEGVADLLEQQLLQRPRPEGA